MEKITFKTALIVVAIIVLLAAAVVLYIKYVPFAYCMTGLISLIMGIATGIYAKTFYDRYIKK